MHEFGWVGVGHPGRGVLGAWGIAHLIRIRGSAEPPRMICASIPQMCSPMTSTKIKQTKMIRITSTRRNPRKSNAQINYGWVGAWICGEGHQLTYTDLHFPAVSWFQMTLMITSTKKQPENKSEIKITARARGNKIHQTRAQKKRGQHLPG